MTRIFRSLRDTPDDAEPEERPRPVRVEVSVKTIVLLLATAVGIWIFLAIWPVLVVLVVALMIVGTLNPFIARIERRGIRRSHATGLVFGVLFAAIAGFCAFTVPRFMNQLSDVLEELPAAQSRLAAYLQATKFGAPLAKLIRDNGSTEIVAYVERVGFSYSSKFVEIIAYTLTSIFLGLYLILDRDRMRGSVFALVPRSYHVRTSRVLINLESIVGGYMRGQVITSVMMAIFTFAVLSIARVPNAVALALFAGVVDVLPYVGGLLACAPAVLTALGGGLTTALLVGAALTAYQEIESRIIIPRIYGKVLRLPAATVMISLLIGGRLLGIVGVFLALPIAAGLRMMIEELRVELPGDDSAHPVVQERDARCEEDFARRTAGAPPIEAAAIATEIAEARFEQEEHDPAEAPRDTIREERPRVE